MSDKSNGKAKVKKEKKPVNVTEENLRVVRSVATLTVTNPAIRKALNCTWGEAVPLRKAFLKG